MKRKILLSVGLVCMMISFHSCDKLGNCQVCSQVKRDTSSGSIISEGNEAEYCDAELIAIKATPPVTVGNATTKYECR
jgi:hypothetical protein